MPRLGGWADDAAGIADSDGMGRDGFRHDGTSADDGACADGDARKDFDIAAEPTVIFDGDGLGTFDTLIATRDVVGVFSSVATEVGSDKAVCTDGDGRAVHKVGTVIDEGGFANGRVGSVVSVDRGEDGGGGVCVGEELSEKCRATGFVGWGRIIKGKGEGVRFFALSEEFRVEVGIVPIAGEHFFFFGHGVYYTIFELEMEGGAADFRR